MLPGTRLPDRAEDAVNDHTGRGRRRQWPAGPQHAGALAAAIAGTALLVAACGGGDPPGSAKPDGHRAFRKEVAYVKCMRSHGLPSFPDPLGDGIFDITVANRADFSGPAYASANGGCAHLEGTPATAAQLHRSVTEALRYAACMRAHGIASFHASASGDHVLMGFQGSGAQANSTQFLIAQRVCQPLLPKRAEE
jgi:hypothetical protein